MRSGRFGGLDEIRFWVEFGLAWLHLARVDLTLLEVALIGLSWLGFGLALAWFGFVSP